MALWVWLIVVGFSNAVNLSDGLDGLVTMPIVSMTLGLIGLASSNALGVMGWIVIGTCLGFLWFNAPPAKIFMGDTGSLAFGAMCATWALFLHKEWWLLLLGVVPVMALFSVMLQVLYFKRTGRRLFKMAPIHHHFELLGWSESKIMVRFWIIAWLGLMLTLLGTL